MDISLIMFAMWVLGLASGVLIGRSWVTDRELQRYCDETEHGGRPL